MNTRHLFLTCALCIPLGLSAQNMLTTGSATSLGANTYRLTPASQGQVGAVWGQSYVNLNYDFWISADINLGSMDDIGADGMAFVFEDQDLCTMSGGDGGGLGYAGISPSVAVEFDTWSNDTDPVADHVGIQKNGDFVHSISSSIAGPVGLSYNLENGNYHPIVISWNAGTKYITVVLNGATIINQYAGNIVTDIFSGNNQIMWGFTAATGSVTNDQRVRINQVSYIESGLAYADLDGDGYYICGGDCDDTNPDVHPGAGEILDNGIDDNCDGLVDILVYCTPYDSYACEYFWITNVTLAGINNSSDCGADGYTDFRALSASLEPGATYTISTSFSGFIFRHYEYCVYVDWSRDGDFDDSGEMEAYRPLHYSPISANISVPGDATGSYTMRVIAGMYVIDPCYIYFGEAEDYTIFVCSPSTYYRDNDGDGYGNPAVTTISCAAPNGFVANNGDCDDGDASVKPGAAELCDGKDNDCDGQIDEPSAISSPWTAVNVGAEAQGSSWFDCTNGGTFTLSAKGYTTNTSDVQHSVYQTLCGNGDIIAHVASISTQGGWAGIQMRESASQGAKKFTLKTQLNTNNRREARTATNGSTNNLQIQRPFTYNWLRITRSGNVFAAYLSVDGVNWGQPVSSTTMTMNSCIQVGLFVESTNNTITTRATFNNVFISGGNQPLAEAPFTHGVPDMEMAHEVSLFPNPSTGELNVDLPSYAGRAVRLEIYSLQGQLLHFVEIQEVQTTERLDLSAYPSGMYLLKVKSEGLPDVSKRLVLKQ